ncbi:MAG: lysophospholipid acyltransferase family protein [Leptospirillum sp.]
MEYSGTIEKNKDLSEEPIHRCGPLMMGAAFFVSMIVRCLKWTIRCHYSGFTEYRKKLERKEPVLIAFWHNQGLFMPFVYYGRWGKVRIIVSRSRDGALISSLLWWFGILSVRGSSSKGGSRALRELLKLGKDGCTSLVFTPDGPKGPIYEVKEGVAFLAGRTKKPLYLLSVAYTRFKECGSWDRFRIPGPFGKAYFACSPPLCFEPATKGVELEIQRLTIEKCLNRLNEITTALAESQITLRESEHLLSPAIFISS